MIHFTPTSASRLSLVKRFSADLTDDVIRAGSFAPVDLVRDIKTPSRRAEAPATPRLNCYRKRCGGKPATCRWRSRKNQ